METFNFNFKCQHCVSYKNRREKILNRLFDEKLLITSCHIQLAIIVIRCMVMKKNIQLNH